MANTLWPIFDIKELNTKFSTTHGITTHNDFVAEAYNLTYNRKHFDQLTSIKNDEATPNTVSIILGIGTGCGQAIL